ncbi:TetR/AcrR family transcriptional regulator [Pseudonocardiaceae bacterium YIM PH 21723]|nr:TetR/AcrR family transcriptional regulator [Pseudonocardiaceae bacterium YIM PH 21723]
MPRPRTFDEQHAVQAAMRVFWEHGYEATSTQDLCDATGLGRSSIYNTFTSKHDLFTRALVHYMDDRNERQLTILRDDSRSARERIEAFLTLMTEGEAQLGCFVVNTIAELAPHDPEIATLLDRDRTLRLGIVEQVIACGQRDGTITAAQPPAALATYLNAVIAGIRIAGQGGADQPTRRTIADTALRAFNPD